MENPVCARVVLTVSHPVTKEEIGNLFWPELTPPQLKTRFKNEIYRLRRALGQDAVLFDGEFYYFNKNLDYEYDVDIFKSALENSRMSQNADEKITHYQTAVNVVHGLFLEDIGALWVMTEREHLNQEYLSALLSLAKLYMGKDQEQKALQACQQMLARDPCHEEAHRLIMQIYALVGDRSAVVRQYQACQSTLETVLGVLPSPQTEELFHQLTNKVS
jgi:LuxR family maltose regulon positive regulatory protein